MRDVALVPEGHVLDARLRVAAKKPRDAGDPLGDDRVALVRHRRRTLLGAGAERLLHLTDLGPLEVADLGCEALEPGAGQCDRVQQLRVTVARNHLGRDVLAAKPQAAQDRRLDLGAVRRVVAHSAGQRPDRHPLHRPFESPHVAVGLERKAGELHPEGRGLGVHAVRAPDAERVHVLTGPPDERVAIVARPADEDQARLRELEREGRVDHVGGGEAVMHPPARLAHRAGHDVHEGGHVVIRHPLALLDGVDRERGPVAHGRGVVLGHHPLLRERLHNRELHLQPGLELAPFGPDRAHLGTGVAVDHELRIRAASTAAFFALSTPTVATGTPGGIWEIASRASRPPATEVLVVSGTPITGRSVCAATTPGSAAASPAPAMITRRPRRRAFLA
jgi:hypothetical protein